MTERRAAVLDGVPAIGLIVAILVAVTVVLGAWFAFGGGWGGPSVTVNTHTDNAVPTVDLPAPRPPVIA